VNAFSNVSPDRSAICHALAVMWFQYAVAQVLAIAHFVLCCLFSIGWRPFLNEKQTTEKTHEDYAKIEDSQSTDRIHQETNSNPAFNVNGPGSV
jgi:hypothetical protein